MTKSTNNKPQIHTEIRLAKVKRNLSENQLKMEDPTMDKLSQSKTGLPSLQA